MQLASWNLEQILERYIMTLSGENVRNHERDCTVTYVLVLPYPNLNFTIRLNPEPQLVIVISVISVIMN